MLMVRGRQQMIVCSRAPDSACHAVIAASVEDPAAFLPMITHPLPSRDALAGFDLAHQRVASKVLLYP